MLEDNPELILSRCNRQLAELLGTEPPPLSQGGASAIEDRLWIWGVVGGKDVGKTTLINALAGGSVVPAGVEVGEGTFEPQAYLTDADQSAFQNRLDAAKVAAVRCHPQAPQSMHGLVLVDLPDFDSLFLKHVEQVRQLVLGLDGIIWVTTPKKIGDLRALNEIDQMLKSRRNFVYVVNKLDWLLSQADGPPASELKRVQSALERQITECDPTSEPGRMFLVAAKYPDRQAILGAIAQQRHGKDTESDSNGPTRNNGKLASVADQIATNFNELRIALTSAPTAEASSASKRANLTYQVRRQARQLLDHHKPRPLIELLDEVADPDSIRAVLEQSLAPSYCAQVVERLNSGRILQPQWAASLFKARIVHWPLLGLVAWPVSLIGGILGSLRDYLPRGVDSGLDDPFRLDGISLTERIDSATSGLQAELGSASRRIDLKLPTVDTLERTFSQDAQNLSEQQRAMILEPLLSKRPGVLGRFVRAMFTFSIILWFPLAQPVLAAVFAQLEKGLALDAGLLRTLIQALSAAQILIALSTTLVILAVLTAAVYSRAARDSLKAIQRLQDGRESTSGLLVESLTAAVSRPIEATRASIAEPTTALEQLADQSTPETSA